MAHIFHNLIDVETARRLASENIAIDRPAEEISPGESLGRVLASDIRAPINTPPFNRSIKDGYAVRSEELSDASEKSPVRLKVAGSINIGHPPGINVVRGTCVQVPTGGVMPEGADSVVMVEYTHLEGAEILVYRPTRRGENIALAGSDIPVGELIIRQGRRIGPREIAVMSSLGLENVKVKGRIRIGIASTGDELAQPGEHLTQGKIYESNGRTIRALIDQEGGLFDTRFYGTLPDDEDLIRKRVHQFISENDIVILSGSTSAGEKDMVYRILGELDPGTVFHGVKIKPGKPTLMAKSGDRVVIGLPGFPVSAMMTFLTIFFPFMLREAGAEAMNLNIAGTLAGKVDLDLGKLNLIPVSLATRKAGYVAFPIHGGSGSISRLLRADGYVSVVGDSRTLEEGENVQIVLFNRYPPKTGYVVVGEPDPTLDQISKHSSGNVKIIRTGHYGAIISVNRGYSDAAGIVHPAPDLDLDAEPLVKDLTSIWSREIGLGLVLKAKGNGKQNDLTGIMKASGNIAIPSRAEGTFGIIEETVEKHGISREEFFSKAIEAGNFNSVAFSVSEGYYQAGISSIEDAERYGLGFIPLARYFYHIVSRKGSEKKLSFLTDMM